MQWQRLYIYLFYYMRVSLGLIQCIRDWPCKPWDLPNVFYRVQAEKLSHCQTGTQRVMRTHFLQPFHFHVDGSFLSLALICLLSTNASSNREQIYSMQIKLCWLLNGSLDDGEHREATLACYFSSCSGKVAERYFGRLERVSTLKNRLRRREKGAVALSKVLSNVWKVSTVAQQQQFT